MSTFSFFWEKFKPSVKKLLFELDTTVFSLKKSQKYAII
jgi:hypothetical protein